MSRNTGRLRNLVADELGECRDADVERRLAELDALAAEAPADVDADLAALKALGDETRHRIVRLLVAAGDERCVCEILPLADVSDSAVSHALSDLADAGLVARRRSGQWRYYRATPRAEALVAALDDTREATA
jgi:DNA-binding transcriptional ArsR family regulator